MRPDEQSAQRSARLAETERGRKDRRRSGPATGRAGEGRMTEKERLALLQKKTLEMTQAGVARRMGYSPATISQVLSGVYRGDLAAVLQRAEECFSPATVPCPALGRIVYSLCVEERRQPFSMASPHRVAMYKACRACALNEDTREG